jgi:hypothetical protein
LHQTNQDGRTVNTDQLKCAIGLMKLLLCLPAQLGCISVLIEQQGLQKNIQPQVDRALDFQYCRPQKKGRQAGRRQRSRRGRKIRNRQSWTSQLAMRKRATARLSASASSESSWMELAVCWVP